jgi:hypothetical protein
MSFPADWVSAGPSGTDALPLEQHLDMKIALLQSTSGYQGTSHLDDN